MKTPKVITLLICFIAFIVVSVNAGEIDYTKHFSLKLSYNQKDSGVFTVILKNTSKTKYHVILNTEEIESDFTTLAHDKKVAGRFNDKEYLNKLMTSVWFSGTCEIKPEQEVKWTVKLNELVYFRPDDKSVTHESLVGKTISLRLDRFSVIPAQGKSNVYVKLTSNSIKVVRKHTDKKN